MRQVVGVDLTRALLPEELRELLPASVARGAISTASARMPLEVMITEQSDRASVHRALEAELAGGPRSGFQPAREQGSFTITFHTAVVSGTRS